MDGSGNKPPFYDIVGNWKYDAWESLRGTDQILSQKLCIELMHEIMTEFGYADMISDPNRPGPDYYSDCKKFNWIDALRKNHK